MTGGRRFATVPPVKNAPPSPDIRTENAPLGIMMMLVSVFIFSILNLLVKLTAERYPLAEVTFFRNLLALVPVGIAVAMGGGLPSLRTAHPLGHLWRSAIGLTAMSLMFWSFHLLPLGTAIAFNFTAPLFLTALAVPLLGERVGLFRWAAVAVGFGGTLIMLRPTGDMLEIGALVALAAAVCQALAMVTIRQLSRTESPDTIVFYFTLITTFLCALAQPFVWVTPQGWDWALLAGCGLTGGVAQLFMTRAYALAPAAVVAPFNYASLLFALLFGWMFWNEIPDAWTLLGAAVVAGSGLYILHRETVRRAAVTAPAPTHAD